MQMINVSSQILKFRQFLLHSWNDLDKLMENHDWDDDGNFIDDWMQANWEFLVERQLLGKTGVLNNFGMAYKRPRITDLNARKIYEIFCLPKAGRDFVDARTGNPISQKNRLVFRVFLTRVDNTFGLYPPFDHVEMTSTTNKEPFIALLEEVEFFMCAP